MVLQKMRAGAQGAAAKVLVGLIVFVLAVTGFGAIQFFSGGEPIAATVNGDDITQRVLELETDRRRAAQRNQLGGEVSEELLDALVAPRAVLESLIVGTLIDQLADELGLSISEQTVQQRIRESFAGIEGFNDAAYRSYLAGMGYTPNSFLAEQATREVQRQLTASIGETSFVTRRERSRFAQIVDQRRDIAYLLFDIESFAATVEVDAAEVETHYGEFIDDYMTEETFDFSFVRLLRTPFEADVEVEDAEIELAYQDEIAARPEPKRHAAHILLTVTDTRSAVEATQTLADVRAAIEAGASFEEQARQLSEDTPTAEIGGDLGPVGRDAFPEAFETALWALAPGEMSEPVETEFGVHLIRLIGIEEDEIPTLAERRDDIAGRLRSEEANRRFAEALDEMRELAFEEGDSLAGLAEHFGLAIESVERIARSSREALFADAAVREAAFGDEVLVEGYNSDAVATADAAVVVRLAARHPSVERPLDDVREEIRAKLSRDKARLLVEDAAFDALARYAGGETPAAIADAEGIAWQRSDGVRRGDPTVPGEILARVFEMEAPAPGERDSDIATLADGSRALVLLSNVLLGDYAALSENDRDDLGRNLEQLAANQALASVVRTLRADASISTIDFGEG